MRDFLLKINKLPVSSNDSKTRFIKSIFKQNNFSLMTFSDCIKFNIKSTQVFIFGHIDYINFKKKKKFSLNNKNIFNELKKNILKTSRHDKIEGHFCCVIINKNNIIISSDRNKSYEVFYQYSKNSIIISNFMDIETKNSYKNDLNQISIINILNTYGNYAPKKNTIYKNINRLGLNQFFKINPKTLSLKKINYNSKPYIINKDPDIEDYRKSLNESISLRSSNKMNWILMSSGWDSSSILAILNKIKGPKKITAVIGRVKFSDKYGFTNDLEIEKAKKICLHYKITLKVINVDFSSSNYLKNFKRYKTVLKSHGLYSLLSYNQLFLSEYISKKASKKLDVVFCGEISDGAHNFGFSQYATFLNHDDLNLREYFDKMHSYMYSPSFFSKIKNKNFKKDYVFNTLIKLKNIKLFKNINKNKILKYIIPLFLSQNRLPFENFLNSNLFSQLGKFSLFNIIQKDYFNNVVKIIDEKNFYGLILQLYNSFHWQSTQVRCMIHAPYFFGMKSYAPFRDTSVLKFLSCMPENWGRGLELKPTKYPLKEILKDKKLNYPTKIQIGPHSYLYDTNPNWNPKEDLIYHSKAREMFLKKLKKLDINKVFEKKFFDLANLRILKKNYLLNKKEKGKKIDEIFNLISFSTIFTD